MDKLDILQKLIALANNNPNENEANTAARRVCKMLAEMKVNFKRNVASNKVPPPTPRQQANPWAYDNPFASFDVDMERIFRMVQEEARRAREEQFRHRSYSNPFDRGFNPDSAFRQGAWEGPFYTTRNEPKSKKEKREIICNLCDRKV